MRIGGDGIWVTDYGTELSMISISEKGVEWTDDGSCKFEGNKVVGGPKKCCTKTSKIMRAVKVINGSGWLQTFKVFDKKKPEVTVFVEAGHINPNTMGLVCQCGKHHA